MNVITWFKAGAIAAKAFAIANGPTILFVGGIIVGGVAIAHAISDAVKKDTSELEAAADDIRTANELLKNPDETTDISELRHAKKSSVARFLKLIGKLYGKTLLLALISAGLLASGFYWQSRRFAIAASAAASSAAVISTIDNNIRSVFGESGVTAMHDPNFDAEAFKAKASANGSTEALEKVNEEFKDYRPSGIKVPGDWIFTFREETVRPNFWKNTVRDNALTLVNVQNQLNNLLAKYETPFVTVNMALQWLGLDEEYAFPAGNSFGWAKGDFVDFGLAEILARLQIISDDRDVGSSRSDIWRDYGEGFILHFYNVRFLDDNACKGARPLMEVASA
jgi:hypothetical protein